MTGSSQQMRTDPSTPGHKAVWRRHWKRNSDVLHALTFGSKVSGMRVLVLLAVFASYVGAQAHATETSLYPAPNPFNERLTERVPVSGRALVGVIATKTAELPSGKGLVSGRLILPRLPAGAVCVRARTQDGRYTAENTYVSATDSAEPQALAWSDAYVSILRSIPLQQIAALATLGACGSAVSVVIPTMMDSVPAQGTRFLQVLVNTRGATTWAVLRDPVAGGAALSRIHCVRLEDGARVAYDARCLFGPLPDHEPLELRLEQEGRDGRSLEVVEKVRLRIDSAPP